MEANMAIEIRVPPLGESVVDAVIAGWLKHEGDEVKLGEALVELETDKVNVEVSAEQSGVLQKILKQEGDVVAVGDVLGTISESVEALAPADIRSETPVVQQPELPAADGQRQVTPLARRIANEYSIDL